MTADVQALIARLRDTCRKAGFEDNRDCAARNIGPGYRCLQCSAADALTAAAQATRTREAAVWDEAATYIQAEIDHLRAQGKDRHIPYYYTGVLADFTHRAQLPPTETK